MHREILSLVRLPVPPFRPAHILLAELIPRQCVAESPEKKRVSAETETRRLTTCSERTPLIISHSLRHQRGRARRIEQQTSDEHFVAGVHAANPGYVDKNCTGHGVHIHQADA